MHVLLADTLGDILREQRTRQAAASASSSSADHPARVLSTELPLSKQAWVSKYAEDRLRDRLAAASSGDATSRTQAVNGVAARAVSRGAATDKPPSIDPALLEKLLQQLLDQLDRDPDYTSAYTSRRSQYGGRNLVSPIQNQGDCGSCTSFAT